MMTDNTYHNALKKLGNCQFRYALSVQEETVKAYVCEIAKEAGVLGGKVRRVFGDCSDITIQELETAEQDFFKQCKGLTDAGENLYPEYLPERFALSEFERHCVRLLYLFETDAVYADAAALLQDGWDNHTVTPYLAELTFGAEENTYSSAFGKNSLLSSFFLADDEDDGTCFCRKKIRLAARMRDALLGDISIAPAYGYLLQYKSMQEPLDAWIGAEDAQMEAWWEQAALHQNEAGGQMLYLYGEAGSGRRFSILHACKKRSYDCCFIDMDAFVKESESAPAADKRNWQDGLLRELILLEAVPVFVLKETDRTQMILELEQAKELLLQIARIFPFSFLCAKEKVLLEREIPVTYLFRKPLTLMEGRRFWKETAKRYPLSEGTMPEDMANRFQLTPEKICRIVENADKSRIQNGESVLTMERISEECYGLMEQQMGKRTVKVPAVYHMEDLVLPARQKQQLLDICNQVKYKHKVYEEWGFQKKTAYGQGISMVFAGPPGTGKTMAAQVIAGELGMELYKVNLSGVVSKYVGETEKNLEEIFEQARRSQVILFFDEADVLFGKRSEGKETSDKYSNMEAAFLLQKMEAYEGITVLATNLFHHFDEAFKRRLKAVIEFSMPDQADRKRLWKTMIPKEMPVGEIDYDYLAGQFEISGSNIRNILLQSAFFAAVRGKAVSMEDIIPAVKNEFAKNGKMLLKSDVSEYYMYLE